MEFFTRQKKWLAHLTATDLITAIQTYEFINDKKWTTKHFNWQEGYDVFSYAHSQNRQGMQICYQP
jgi:hypothetical protein